MNVATGTMIVVVEGRKREEKSCVVEMLGWVGPAEGLSIVVM